MTPTIDSSTTALRIRLLFTHCKPVYNRNYARDLVSLLTAISFEYRFQILLSFIGTELEYDGGICISYTNVFPDLGKELAYYLECSYIFFDIFKVFV